MSSVNSITNLNPPIISPATATAAQVEALTKSQDSQPWQEALKLLDAIEIPVESYTLDGCKKSAEKITKALENSDLTSNVRVVGCLHEAAEALQAMEAIIKAGTNAEEDIDEIVVNKKLIEAANAIDVARIEYAQEWQSNGQALVHAIEKRDCEMAEKLMDEGISRPDLEVLSLNHPLVYHDLEDPITAVSDLGFACMTGSVRMVRLLMQRGANPNLRGVPPAWLILLVSPLPREIKQAIWREFNGKANLMLFQNEVTRYLSKAFGSMHVHPLDLHMALSSMDNLREKTHAAKGTFVENLCLGILYSTLNPATTGWYFGDREIKVTQAHTHHAIRLGAVMICHGLIGNPNDNELPELFNEKADFNGKQLSLEDILKLRRNIEKRMDYYVEALIETPHIGQSTISKDSWNIVLQYLQYTPDQRNGVIAGECMKLLFSSRLLKVRK